MVFQANPGLGFSAGTLWQTSRAASETVKAGQSSSFSAKTSTEGLANLLWDEGLWVERARQGDEAAFAAIYDHYENAIYACVYRLMGNADDAYDLTQDVFVKAYKALSKTAPDLNLSAWLHRIASNTCLDVLRRRKIVRWLPWDPAEHANITPAHDGDEPEKSLMAREQRELVQTVLNKLNEKYRLCLVLKEYQDLSCDEIADIMGTSRAAVKSLLFRAREQFREVYTELENAHTELAQGKAKSRKGGR